MAPPGSRDERRSVAVGPLRRLAAPVLRIFRRQDQSQLSTRQDAAAHQLDAVAASVVTRLDSVAARLDALEGLLVARFDLLSGQADALGTRLAGMEGRLAARFDLLGGQSDALGARLAGMEGRLAARFDLLGGQADALGARLAGMEAVLHPLTRCVPLGTEVLSRTPWGWLLHPVEDLALLAGMMDAGGMHEAGTRIVLQSLLTQGDLCVDAGAHIGILTVVMAHAVLPGGQVVAIEPTPRLAALLRQTVVLNNMQALVTVEACAVGREDGTATLSTHTGTMNSSLVPLEDGTGAIQVPVRRLDSLIVPGTRVAVAKIDVEGVELDALAGMSRVIADSPDIALVVEFGPSHLKRAGIAVDDWIGAFRVVGFTPWEIVEPEGTIRPLRGAGLDAVLSLNLLMLRHAPQRWPRLKLAG